MPVFLLIMRTLHVDQSSHPESLQANALYCSFDVKVDCVSIVPVNFGLILGSLHSSEDMDDTTLLMNPSMVKLAAALSQKGKLSTLFICLLWCLHCGMFYENVYTQMFCMNHMAFQSLHKAPDHLREKMLITYYPYSNFALYIEQKPHRYR